MGVREAKVDFYHVAKVDNHIHLNTGMGCEHLREFIKKKIKDCPDVRPAIAMCRRLLHSVAVELSSSCARWTRCCPLLTSSCQDVVWMDENGQDVTLSDVFEQLGVKWEHITIDSLSMRVCCA